VLLGGHDYGAVSVVAERLFCAPTPVKQGAGHHRRTIVEIAADVKERDTYCLEGGDHVDVELGLNGSEHYDSAVAALC
jgi:CTP-dependent riboflavin kinase